MYIFCEICTAVCCFSSGMCASDMIYVRHDCVGNDVDIVTILSISLRVFISSSFISIDV